MAKEPRLTPVQQKRRQVLQGLLAGGAASALPASLLASHPVHHHMTSGAAVMAADQTGEDGDWTPRALSPHQAQTLDVLGERIVPGSSETRAYRFVDRLLSLDSRDTQAAFLVALAAFESESRGRFERPFVQLTEAEQVEVLEASAEAERQHPRSVRDWGWFNIPAHTEARDQDLGDALSHVRGWIAGAYYSSEKGMKELGWTGDVFFETYPGCKHPHGHG